MSGTPLVGVHRRDAERDAYSPHTPTAADLEAAKEIVASAHGVTPLVRSNALSDLSGRDVHLKMEGTSAVRSFKYRGALAAVAHAAAADTRLSLIHISEPTRPY